MLEALVAIGVLLAACFFVCWLDKGKRDTQRDGVCDFSGQGRDDWKNNN